MNLDRLKQTLKDNKAVGLALDIDHTLSHTTQFWISQMQKKFGNPENLSPFEMLDKYGYAQNVPYWQHAEAFKWMNSYIDSNEIQEKLLLIENSNSIVQKINKIMPIAIYLTGRPESVLEGTRKWLRKHNFPDVDIIMRPKDVPADKVSKWKANILAKLYPQIVGIIDDQSSLADALPKEYKGTIYLYDNIEHPRKDIHVIPCKTWDDVLSKIQNG